MNINGLEWLDLGWVSLGYRAGYQKLHKTKESSSKLAENYVVIFSNVVGKVERAFGLRVPAD